MAKQELELMTKKRIEKYPTAIQVIINFEFTDEERKRIRNTLATQLDAGCLQVRLRLGEMYFYMTRRVANWMARQLFFVKEIDCFYPMTWYCIQKIWTEKDEQKLHEKYLVLKEQAEKQAAFYEERRKEMFGQPEIVGYGNGEPQNEQ